MKKINKTYILMAFTVVAFILGLIGFWNESKKLEALTNTIGLFAFSYPPFVTNTCIEIAKILSSIVVFSGIYLLFISKALNGLRVWRTQRKPFTLLVGLGEQNSAFLESASQDTLVIESDVTNVNITHAKQHGFGVKVAQVEDIHNIMNVDKLKNCIVSTHSDRKNITMTTDLLQKLSGYRDKNIFVRVENRKMSTLFNDICKDRQKEIEVVPYSLYENIAKSLFSQHTILGNMPHIAQSSETYSVILVGSSNLSLELLYHIVILSHLPEQNRLKLYVIESNVKQFEEKIKKLYTAMDAIPHLELIPLALHSDTKAFYTHEVWREENLTNIFIATDNDDINLDIAINLADITYLKRIGDGSLQTKILFAIYNSYGLSQKIDQDTHKFKNFYTFADRVSCSTKEIIIDSKLDKIAKMINVDYKDAKENILNAYAEKWNDLSFHKKLSNKAQALHIDTKLIVVGLKRQKSEKTIEQLLELNQEIFSKTLPEVYDENRNEFPKTFNTLLQKLARTEHNRWNSFHYLYGWRYNEIRDDHIKYHNCLTSFDENFPESAYDTYQYDVLSITEIPKYLAFSGYEIVENS